MTATVILINQQNPKKNTQQFCSVTIFPMVFPTVFPSDSRFGLQLSQPAVPLGHHLPAGQVVPTAGKPMGKPSGFISKPWGAPGKIMGKPPAIHAKL
jgi:hypothetical protein